MHSFGAPQTELEQHYTLPATHWGSSSADSASSRTSSPHIELQLRARSYFSSPVDQSIMWRILTLALSRTCSPSFPGAGIFPALSLPSSHGPSSW